MNRKGVIILLAGLLAVALTGSAWAANTATLYQYLRTVAPSTFKNPCGIAAANSITFVADTGNNRILAIDPSNTPTVLAELGGFNNPAGIAAIKAGSNTFVYVADTGNNRIQAYQLNKNGNNYSFSPVMWSIGGLSSPKGFVVDNSGIVYVADTGNNSIKKYNSSGVLQSFPNPSGLSGPAGIAYDSKQTHYLYVADTGNNRILRFNGTSWDQWGSGQFNSPTGITVDNSGYVFVVDTGNPTTGNPSPRVQKFDYTNGAVLAKWGSWGTGNYQFKGPQGILATDKVDVCDAGNNRIQEFSSFTATADAGGVQSVPDLTNGNPTLVTLNGLNSRPSGQIVSYQWTQTNITDPSLQVTLSDPASPTPTFYAPNVPMTGAALTFQLTVNFNTGQVTDSGIVNVTWVNRPPQANAGGTQTVPETTAGVPTQVTLDGSGSADPDDGIASYFWEQIGTSPGVTLSNQYAQKPTFSAPDVGVGGAALTFRLTVTDNHGLMSTAQCIVNIQWVDVAPVANAGGNQTVNEKTPVTLNGSGSDVDGNIASYLWVQDPTDPIQVQLSNANSKIASFTAPEVGPAGAVLNFQLKVTDTNGLYDTKGCTVTVVNVNSPPTANPGGPYTVIEKDQLTLNGTGSSDPDNDTLKYSWTWVSTEPSALGNVPLTGADTAQPTFIAPEVGKEGATLVFQLTVTDLDGAQDSATCKVIVQNFNTPPVVEAGDNRFVYTQDEAASNPIIGTASDPDGDLLTYRWVDGGTVDAATGQVLGGTLLASGSVGADGRGRAPLNLAANPLGTGIHTLNLEVFDGTAHVTDSMQLTIQNSPPTPGPTGGGTYRMSEYATKPVTLGGQVSDYDGDLVTYWWVEGDTVLNTGTVQTVPGGTPVDLLPAFKTTSLSIGDHMITLKVNDGVNTVTSNPVKVTIIDDVPPTLTYTVDKSILWPPNKAMVDPGIKVSGSDNCGGPVKLTATLACKENNNLAYGNEGIDWIWGDPKIKSDGTINLELCADRLGKGNGRTYTVTITASDSAGNQSTADIKIQVPHDQGKN